MNKFWLVFAQEYKRHVLRKRFIFAILSMPLFVGFIVLIGFLSVRLQYNSTPVGYLDLAGVLSNPKPVPVEKDSMLPSAPFVAYPDEQTARSDLNSGKIQAYFVISKDYINTGDVTFIKAKKTGSNVEDDFSSFMSYNLLSNSSPDVINRLTKGNNIVIRSLDGKREFSSQSWLSLALPFIAGILFIIAVNISGGYLLQAVVEEKENRTMEIVITSVSPAQLMSGKVLADLLVGLTELAVWIAFVLLALNIVPQWIPIGQSMHVDFSAVALMAATFLPSFVMVAAAMGAVGATATEVREAQQIASLFTLPIVIPFWFVSAIMFNPNGALSVGLSLFPMTAPIALPLRAAFTDIPFWQMFLSIGLLCLLAIFAVWLAGRVFRLGMLRYGKRISFSEIFRRQTA